MDKLDKISFVVLVVLLVWIAALVVRQIEAPQLERQKPGGRIESGIYSNPEFDKKTDTARKLLAAGNLELAEQLVKALSADFPYEGTPRVLLADLYIRKQNPVAAMLEHKRGIELNPDFLDKKTALFQGKVIKRNLDDALIAIEEALQRNPADLVMLENKKTYNYLKRRIAGSCN